MIHYAKQGWLKSDDNYPVRLSMLIKLVGSLFDALGVIITSKYQ